jgi:hypothetical protein
MFELIYGCAPFTILDFSYTNVELNIYILKSDAKSDVLRTFHITRLSTSSYDFKNKQWLVRTSFFHI